VTHPIDRLDELIQSLLKVQTISKPWQRSLVQNLNSIDTQIEVLRILILLRRDREEIKEAANLLREKLAWVSVQTDKSRAEVTIKKALKVAKLLASQVHEEL